VAVKALARQSDVEPTSVKVEPEERGEGRVVFAARPGCSLDLEKIHACLKETRLSGKPPGKTRSQIHYLELTAVGDVVESNKGLLLKVKGTREVFRLEEPGPKAIGRGGTAFQQLQKAVAAGQQVISVTGRVKGWNGHFPAVLREVPAEVTPLPENQHGPPVRRPPLLSVVGFAEAKQ
jgi:hypothetical protein